MLREWLIEYSHDVINGEIIACQKHKWACGRFLRDIEREGTEQFPYVFNEEKALRFLNWMALFKHTKGKLQGKTIEPVPIQIFNFSNIYGWEHKETKLRRFKKAYWQVGRKNAKSQSLACVTSYESSALGENMSEVYIGATKTEQSKIIWNEVEAQINGSSFLRDRYKVAYGKIKHIKSNSFITALSKDANKSGDGFNPQCAVIDEYHAHQTSEILDVLQSGMGARSQPLTMIITTAGFNLNHPCYSVEYKYVSQILDPDNPIENDEYFVMVNELDKDDSIKDERNWEKANPIICSYEEGMNYLRGELKAALDVPEKMRNFLTKNMNIWVDQKDNGYMELSKWNACGTDDLPELNNREVYIGVDLSAENDLASVSFLIPVEDEKIVILNHSFLPEETLQKKMRTDKFDYALHVKNGWISETPGAVCDYRFIQKYIKGQKELYNWKVKEIGYDDWNAAQFTNEMIDEGFVMVKIVQGMKTLAPPTKSFREQTYKGNIIHNNNPVLTWSIGNAVTRMDHNENFMLDKSKSSERIDPISSVITGYVRAMHHNYLKETDLNKYITDDYLKSLGW